MLAIELATGTVVELLESMGSFLNVKLDDGKVYSCGLQNDVSWALSHPRIGQRIKVFGEIRNGRHLVQRWEVVEGC